MKYFVVGKDPFPECRRCIYPDAEFDGRLLYTDHETGKKYITAICADGKCQCIRRVKAGKGESMKAIYEVFWPGQTGLACEEHAKQIQQIGSIMGVGPVEIRPYDGVVECKNCLNEKAGKGEHEAVQVPEVIVMGCKFWGWGLESPACKPVPVRARTGKGRA